jgi:hypothetical protein
MVKKPSKTAAPNPGTAPNPAVHGTPTSAEPELRKKTGKQTERDAAKMETSMAAKTAPKTAPRTTTAATSAAGAPPQAAATASPAETPVKAPTKPAGASPAASQGAGEKKEGEVHRPAVPEAHRPVKLVTGEQPPAAAVAAAASPAAKEPVADADRSAASADTQSPEPVISDYETIEPPIPHEVEPSPPPPPEHYEEPRYIPPPLSNKYLNKEALRDRLWLRKEFKPIISYVGRLDFQKGVHLIRHGIFFALANGAQFVLLGTSPEHRINQEFWHLKHQLNDNPDCHIEIGFNEELSHLIYAGSDMMIMPSLYEPCGLAQMIALKYGTVPIVRAVGGLADTVFDKDYSHRPPHERNGYVFDQADPPGLESAMRRAIGLWYSYPDEFRQLMVNGMRYDYSWNHPAQHYLNIYDHIRCK